MDQVLPEFGSLPEASSLKMCSSMSCSTDDETLLMSNNSLCSQNSRGGGGSTTSGTTVCQRSFLTDSLQNCLSPPRDYCAARSSAPAAHASSTGEEYMEMDAICETPLHNSLEERIHRWLDEMGVTMVDPRDREDEYFSRKRESACRASRKFRSHNDAYTPTDAEDEDEYKMVEIVMGCGGESGAHQDGALAAYRYSDTYGAPAFNVRMRSNSEQLPLARRGGATGVATGSKLKLGSSKLYQNRKMTIGTIDTQGGAQDASPKVTPPEVTDV